MCDETFSQSSWNTLKFNSIYTLNITFNFNSTWTYKE